MKNFLVLLLVIGAAHVYRAHDASALEVDREVLPRFTLGGRVIASLDIIEHDTDPDEDYEINISDTALLLRLDKRLYVPGVAGGVIGFREPEEEHDIRMHQAYAFYWNRHFEAQIGRTTLRNTFIEFPTIRDDDLLDYTHVGNGSSGEEFDRLYGKTLSLDWIADQKNNLLGAWLGTREAAAGVLAPGGINSYGGGYRFLPPESLQYVHRIRHLGLLFDAQEITVDTEDEWMYAFIAGLEFNLNINPQSNWSTAIQYIFNNGADVPGPLTTTIDQARAKSNTVVGALRYTGRPNLLTRYQAAITVAHKEYRDFDDADQLSVAPSFIYRLGHGVDLLFQGIYTNYDDGLFNGSEDYTIQLGLVFNFDSTFNDTIGERDSILNLEHGYIN